MFRRIAQFLKNIPEITLHSHECFSFHFLHPNYHHLWVSAKKSYNECSISTPFAGRKHQNVVAIINPTRGGFHKVSFGKPKFLFPLPPRSRRSCEKMPSNGCSHQLSSYRSATPRVEKHSQRKALQRSLLSLRAFPNDTHVFYPRSKRKGNGWLVPQQ